MTPSTTRGLGLSRKRLKRHLLVGVGLVVAAVNLVFLWPSSSSSSPFSLSLLSSPRSSALWWEVPPDTTAASRQSPRRRRRVVMCAFDDVSLRLAWTQIQILRSLSPEAAEATREREGGVDAAGTPQPFTPVPVTIYHVAELHASTELLTRVQALGAVDVVDLAPRLSTWTSLAFSATGRLEEQEEKIYLKYYQGFMCKAAGLLHAAGAAEATTTVKGEAAATTREGLGNGVLKDEEEEMDPAAGLATRDTETGPLEVRNQDVAHNEEATDGEELVAVLDLEVILFQDPFSLAETPIFHQTGAYLFSDRRLSRGKEVASFREYQQILTRIYHGYRRATSSQPLSHSEQQTMGGGVPAALADSSIFQGWSWDYGESALLLFDVQRHASTGFLDALQYLLRVDSPTFRHFAYGDKELYWLALALSGAPLQMNPWIPTAVGALEKVQVTLHTDHKGRERVCSWYNALAQATPTHGLFYLNGEGPELSTVEGDRFLFDQGHLSAAKPVDLRERNEGLPKERNMCTAGGGVPLPGFVKAQLQAYHSLYMAFNDTSPESSQALL